MFDAKIYGVISQKRIEAQNEIPNHLEKRCTSTKGLRILYV